MGLGIFITGTDTGVGKTHVAAGLIRAAREQGMSVCPMKPVETGCTERNGKLIPSDALHLLQQSGARESLDLINPYRLKLPLAPSVAAEMEEVRIRKSRLLASYRSLSKKYDITIVEGAGGIMVPLHRGYLLLDLIGDLKLPVIIVARPGLGTINHTLLTIEAARNKGIEILGVILNRTTKGRKSMAEVSNPEVIERQGKVPVLASLSCGDIDSSRRKKREFIRTWRRVLNEMSGRRH